MLTPRVDASFTSANMTASSSAVTSRKPTATTGRCSAGLSVSKDSARAIYGLAAAAGTYGLNAPPGTAEATGLS